MKHQDQHSFVTDDQAVQMGADVAIQFLLITLIQMVSEMADDPRGLRSDVHNELCELVATYKLPPMPQDVARKVRASARKVLDGTMLRSREQAVPAGVS